MTDRLKEKDRVVLTRSWRVSDDLTVDAWAECIFSHHSDEGYVMLQYYTGPGYAHRCFTVPLEYVKLLTPVPSLLDEPFDFDFGE